MKKVFLVSKEYSPLSGGAGVYIHSIMKRVKIHKYTVMANLADKKSMEHINVPENVLSICKNFTSIRYLNSFLFMLYSIFSSFSMKIDCVVGNELVGSISSMFIHFFKRVPLISIIHNVSYKGKMKFIRRLLLKMIFKYSTVIIINGKKLEYDFLKEFGYQYKNKILKVCPGVAIPKFEKIKKPKKQVVLFVGAIYGNKKGVEYLIEAFANVRKKVTSELWIVGAVVNKNFGKMLKNRTMNLGIEKDVKFLGRVDNVFSYYDVCDVFVLPSYSEAETFGIPCIEASAMGKPVVATDILERAGVLVDGKTGIVVPKMDSDKLSEVIITLLNNEKLRYRLGKNGKSYVKMFSWIDSAESFENVIERVAK